MTEIRALTTDDLPRLAAIDRDWPEAEAAALFRQPAFAGLVAVKEGELAGFIFGLTTQDEAEIIQITIADAWRGQGVASILLKAFLDRHARQSCFLEVMDTNIAAIRLYQRAGFAVTGRRRGYYRRNGEKRDAILMRLDTPEAAD